MKKITFLLSLIFYLGGFSQSNLEQEFLVSLNHKYSEDQTTISVYNKDREELIIVTTQKKSLLINVLDSTFQLKRTFEIDRPGKNDAMLLGILQKGDSLLITYSNKLFTGISSQYIDVITGSMYPNISGEKILYQQYLASEIIDNELYVLSIRDNKSDLYVYRFKSDQSMEIMAFPFGDTKFLDDKYEFYLYNLLKKGNLLMQKISDEGPSSIELVSRHNKVYFKENEIILTIDFFRNMTKFISLNLTDTTKIVKDFMQPLVVDNTTIPGSSNSFLYNNFLFQINVSSLQLALNIKSINDGELQKEFRFNLKDTLLLNNSTIMQHGVALDYDYIFFWEQNETRELTKSKQVLRKLGRSDVGINVYEYAGILDVTVGGVLDIIGGNSDYQYNPGFKLSMPPIGYYSALTYSLYKSLRSKTVQFHSLLSNQSFDRLDNSMDNSIFYSLFEILEEKKDIIYVEDFFRVKESYYILIYVKPEKKHNLIRLVPK